MSSVNACQRYITLILELLDLLFLTTQKNAQLLLWNLTRKIASILVFNIDHHFSYQLLEDKYDTDHHFGYQLQKDEPEISSI